MVLPCGVAFLFVLARLGLVGLPCLATRVVMVAGLLAGLAGGEGRLSAEEGEVGGGIAITEATEDDDDDEGSVEVEGNGAEEDEDEDAAEKKVAMPPLGGSVEWKSRALIPAQRTFHARSPTVELKTWKASEHMASADADAAASPLLAPRPGPAPSTSSFARISRTRSVTFFIVIVCELSFSLTSRKEKLKVLGLRFQRSSSSLSRLHNSSAR